MSSPTSPFMDHAAPILQGEPRITDEQRESLWDTFHQSKDPNELAAKLAPLAVPDDTKHRLFQAKQASMPAVEPVDKITAAINKMVALPPEVLDKAEQHPNVLKAITTAATTPEKPAQEAASATSAAPKAPKTPTAQKPVLAPRADGQPHLPPIPDGHKRILASDGGVHDLPEDRLDDARKIDPLLHVLNP